MSDDPTRRMPAEPNPYEGGYPADPPPEGQEGDGMGPGKRTALILAAALVIGLGVALAVIAAGGGDDDPKGSTSSTSSSSTTSSSTTTTTTTKEEEVPPAVEPPAEEPPAEDPPAEEPSPEDPPEEDKPPVEDDQLGGGGVSP